MGFLDRLFGGSRPTYAQLEAEANKHESAGNASDAVVVWRRAVELHPDSVGGYNNLAKNLFMTGSKDEALVWMAKAVDMKPRDSEIQRNYGVLLMECGRLDDAEARFVAAYNIDPDNWIAYLNMAEVSAKQGKDDDEIKFYRYVREHALGKNSAAWRQAVEILRALGEED